MTRYLFCYGSNNPKQLAERLERSVTTKRAVAPDYQRVYRGYSQKWQGGVASIQKKKGAMCFGLVVGFSKDDEKKMDYYEGYPYAYKKKTIKVIVDDEEIDAIAYIAVSKEWHAPSKAYLQAIYKTVSAHWLVDSPSDFYNEF